MSADLSVNFLAAKVATVSRSKAIADAKKMKPPRGHQDNNVPLFILEVHANPERLKWDVFFPEMELYQFAIDKTTRTVIVERK